MSTVTMIFEDTKDGGCRVTTTISPPQDPKKPHTSAAIALSVIAQNAIRKVKNAKTKNRA